MKFVALLLSAAVLSWTCGTYAADKADKTEKTEKTKKGGAFSGTGTLTVTEGEKGKDDKITFTSDGKTYVVKTGKLEKGIEKETVEITGTVSEKKGEGDATELVLTASKIVPVFTGKVSATLDGKKVEKVTIGGTEVELNAKAKDMAEKADGKDVIAHGKKETKKVKGEEVTTIVITDYKLADEKSKK